MEVRGTETTRRLEDQRLDEEAAESELAGSAPLEADADSDSDTERAPTGRITSVQHSGMSRRQLAFISPRLGLLNNIPFVIPFETRVSVFRQLVNNDFQREYDVLQNGPRDPLTHRRAGQTATIRRDHVADDGFAHLHSLGGSQMKMRLQIQFVDEYGNRKFCL